MTPPCTTSSKNEHVLDLARNLNGKSNCFENSVSISGLVRYLQLKRDFHLFAMEEKDTDRSNSPESSREISSSSSDQLESITKRRSFKRKRFIVARDLAMDPGLELGEKLIITKKRVRKTAILRDRDTDDDNSGNYQKVRITPKKRIRKRRKVTPPKCPLENTSSDAESSKSDDEGEFFVTARKRTRRRENIVHRFNAMNSAAECESGDFREKDEPCFLELSGEACDSTSHSGCSNNNDEQYAMHTDEGLVSGETF